MKKKDLQLLLIVAGILIAFCSYQFIFLKYQNKTETVEAENVTLQATVMELEELEAKQDQYRADTETMKNECNDVIQKFASGLIAEDEIMYTYNMEQVVQNDVAVSALTVGEAAQIQYSGSLTAGEYELRDEGISLYDSASNLSFTTSYNGLKSLIQYIYSMPGRKSVNSISLSPSADGYLTGSMTLDYYCLMGTEKAYIPLDIPSVILGKDNIFGMLENAPAEDAQNTGGEETQEAQ